LTCYHCLLEDENGNPEQHYTIALSVERHPNVQEILFLEGYTCVRLRYRNKSADWAILEVKSPAPPLEFIPISLEPVLPDINVKILYCPAALFNEGVEEILSTDTVWAKSLRGTSHHLRYNHRLLRGSSGAPVILRNGCVVAFHQESFSGSRRLPAGEVLAEMTAEDTWDIVSSVVNSVATSYGATGRGIQISKCPRLVQKLRDLQVVH
jgi:hypothetical protein